MTVHEPGSPAGCETTAKPGRSRPDWYPLLKAFRKSDNLKASWQIVNTITPYVCLWVLMIRSNQLGYSYLWTLVLAFPAAAFLVRIFILFHDCVHDSLFTSRRVNTFFGYVLGVLVFTSFEDWRFTHLRHHSTYANLDSRGFGDIWTLTLNEFENASKIKQILYRVYRNPIVLVGLGALFNFLLHNRIPDVRTKRKEWMSVILTNLLILALALIVAEMVGWRIFILVQLPVLWLAGCAGIWLFYVQHQFEGGYWSRKTDWDSLRAAMEGSSFYALPAMLRWFSCNIGYHHIHHLNPMIPNYRLIACYDHVPALQAKEPITLLKSLSCYRLKLWDEDLQKMVGFP